MLVIGAESGHIRATKSWVLGRLLRDVNEEVDRAMRGQEAPHVASSEKRKGEQDGQSDSAPKRDSDAAFQQTDPVERKRKKWEPLRISVFEVRADKSCEHGVPSRDTVWVLGFIVIVIQLIISVLPWILYKNWTIFMITIGGNLLAITGASLPQWKAEKWSCNQKGGATVTITEGNGSRHAMVILQRKGVGLDIETLAIGTRTKDPSRLTRFAIASLALLWTGLLMTVKAMNDHMWCEYSNVKTKGRT